MASKDEQPKRGGFVSVGDLALDMPDVPVLALRQARHFTRLDQVTQLVAAREAVAELGFMAPAARAVQSAAHQPLSNGISTSGATGRMRST